MSERHDRSSITEAHLSRRAFIYVRQSSPGQVKHNTESTRQQRDLRKLAIDLGWPGPELIEDDLGVTANGTKEREGFQRMLTAVMAKEVGIILCKELARLSRNSPDWARLIQGCYFFNTLVSDGEKIYEGNSLRVGLFTEGQL